MCTFRFGCVRAQVESPQSRKPLGTQRQKSELVSSFCRFATPRLTAADLEPKTDPERSEGARPKEKYDYYLVRKNSKKCDNNQYIKDLIIDEIR